MSGGGRGVIQFGQSGRPLKVIPIHTSDRGLYKTCRRRWLWGSHLNRSLEPINQAAPLWFGSAMHYAFKDFHGFGTPLWDSFLTYTQLSREKYAAGLPDELDELVELGRGMLSHYENWLIRRDPLTTHVVEGHPQVEVAFEIDLTPYMHPALLELLSQGVYEVKVVYRGTFDRIAIDVAAQMLWIVEYKTAARMEQGHLMMDPQVSAYMWAASCIYDMPIAGVVYQQHAKRVPNPARILKNGTVSLDKNQATTHKLYRDALCKVYGSPQQSSNAHIEVLNMLGAKETHERDPYVVRTKVTRNEHQIAMEGLRLLTEVHEMLNPSTPMYIHSGQHCSWCPFYSACTSLEDGGDWEQDLSDERIFRTRTRASSEWEIIAHDGLGGVLHSKEARITYDRAGNPSYTSGTQQFTSPTIGDSDSATAHFSNNYVGGSGSGSGSSSSSSSEQATDTDPVYTPVNVRSEADASSDFFKSFYGD